MFSRNDQTGWDQSITFKKAFSIDVEIDFVGVWYAVFLPADRFFALIHAVGIRFAPLGCFHTPSHSHTLIRLSATSAMLCHWTSAVPSLRPTITICGTIMNKKARNLVICRGQIIGILTFTPVIIIMTMMITRLTLKRTGHWSLTCAKFGLLGVTVVRTPASEQHSRFDIIT
jgi:hypothetical protein